MMAKSCSPPPLPLRPQLHLRQLPQPTYELVPGTSPCAQAPNPEPCPAQLLSAALFGIPNFCDALSPGPAAPPHCSQLMLPCASQAHFQPSWLSLYQHPGNVPKV